MKAFWLNAGLHIELESREDELKLQGLMAILRDGVNVGHGVGVREERRLGDKYPVTFPR